VYATTRHKADKLRHFTFAGSAGNAHQDQQKASSELHVVKATKAKTIVSSNHYAPI